MIYGRFSDQPPGASGNLESSVPRPGSSGQSLFQKKVASQALLCGARVDCSRPRLQGIRCSSIRRLCRLARALERQPWREGWRDILRRCRSQNRNIRRWLHDKSCSLNLQRRSAALRGIDRIRHHSLPKKREKCNLCVRYDLLPMCRVAHTYVSGRSSNNYAAIFTFSLPGACIEKTICQTFAKSFTRLSLPSIRVVECGFPRFWTMRATGTVVNDPGGPPILRGKCAVGV